MFQKEIFSQNDFTLHYNIDYPNGFDPQNVYPILFYFHGMGGVGQGVDYIAERGPLQRERMPEDTPFILVVPACDDYTWMGHFSYIVDFIRNIAARPYADDRRGQGMESAFAHHSAQPPDRARLPLFAKAGQRAPVCAACQPR